MSNDWDENAPGDNDFISQFPLNERTARSAVKNNFGVDHDEDPASDTIGKHERVSLIEQAADPAMDANAGILFTKEVDEKLEFFYRYATGEVLQLTRDGKLLFELRDADGTDIAEDGELAEGAGLFFAEEGEGEEAESKWRSRTPAQIRSLLNVLQAGTGTSSIRNNSQLDNRYVQQSAAWRVVQEVKATVTSDEFSASGFSNTALQASITPQFSNSIIEVEVLLNTSVNASSRSIGLTSYGLFRVRNVTNSESLFEYRVPAVGGSGTHSSNLHTLDRYTVNSTSSRTFRLQMGSNHSDVTTAIRASAANPATMRLRELRQ